MTIDERLESIAKSIEAQGEHIQMLIADSQTRHRDIEQLTESIARLSANSEKDGEHVRALVRIAEIHERRLTALENDGTDGAPNSGPKS
jgi:predicted RNase H-like nuclease (RuvC/YqgF family)